MAKATVAQVSAYCDILNERIGALQQDVTALQGVTEGLGDQYQAIREDVARLREQTSYAHRLLEELRDSIRAQDRTLTELRQEIALLRQRLDDGQKRSEEWGRRLWALIPVLLGALLALASGLIVTLARK